MLLQIEFQLRRNVPLQHQLLACDAPASHKLVQIAVPGLVPLWLPQWLADWVLPLRFERRVYHVSVLSTGCSLRIAVSALVGLLLLLEMASGGATVHILGRWFR